MEDEKTLNKRELIPNDDAEVYLKGKGLSQMLTKQKCGNCKFSLATVTYASRPMMTIREHRECEDCGHEEEFFYYLH